MASTKHVSSDDFDKVWEKIQFLQSFDTDNLQGGQYPQKDTKNKAINFK